MSGEPALDNAKELINTFAEKLLALNDGKAIPRQWKNYLLKAIQPAPKKRGVKADYSKIVEVSKALTLNRERLAAPDRTIKDKRGDAKKAIAESQKTSIRYVERIAKLRRQFFDGGENCKPLEEQKRQALIEGIAAGISHELTADFQAEEAARHAKYEEERRKLGILTFPEWKEWVVANFEPHDAIYFDNRRVATKRDLRKLIADMEASQKLGR